jgi:predicted lipase
VPRVHRGFWATWTASNINEAVLDHVGKLVSSASDPASVRLLFTGHSLGGAVAQLAALDVAHKMDLAPRQLTVYTFGCPRLGNHALAAEYEATVPDTWHVINGQDLVTQGMKLWGMYKRAGSRVIINESGNLVVRPTLLESSLLQVRAAVMPRWFV